MELEKKKRKIGLSKQLPRPRFLSCLSSVYNGISSTSLSCRPGSVVVFFIIAAPTLFNEEVITQAVRDAGDLVVKFADRVENWVTPILEFFGKVSSMLTMLIYLKRFV